ncbi:MAG: serine/threonine-protein kinase, partial [Acidobacteriota bacterium]
MSHDRWRRAQEVFESVIELPADQRQDEAARLCGDDEDLLTTVHDLLRADAGPDPMPDIDPVVELEGALDERRRRQWIGRRLGSYLIVDHIGDGGMGSVFLAERADEAFTKQVAVKLIHRTDHDGLQRFQAERQILADLEHPNIARLIDGGTTQEGRPYLVMEHVEGEPITTYCDRHRLTIRQRLELIRQVCAAVGVAHQNLVVHRDLKSANILVTRNGTPKLLDFGIAKLLGGSTWQPETRATGRLGTPDSASPEQVLGGRITTATDVYALGVLLYELLSGGRPYRWRDRTPAEIDAMLRYDVPKLPSQVALSQVYGASPAAVATARGLRPASLRRALIGDLDNIVLRALRREPERRYRSVEQLSEELRRHLEGLPVEAQPPTLTYRLGKLVRRHRVGLVVVLLAIALVISILFQSVRVRQERDRALHEKATAEAVTRFLVESFQEVDPSRSQGDQISARRLLMSGAERARRELTDQPQEQATLLLTIGRILSGLGLYDEAEPLLDDALNQRVGLLGGQHTQVAEVWHESSLLLARRGNFEEADRLVQEALSRQPPRSAKRARTLHLQADIRLAQGQHEESLDLHREALQIERETLSETDRQTLEGLAAVGVAHQRLTHYTEAEAIFRHALALQSEAYPGDRPTTVILLRRLAHVLIRQKKPQEALEPAVQAVEMSRRLWSQAHIEQADTLNTLANVRRELSQAADAYPLYLESLAVSRQALGDRHPRFVGTLLNVAFLLHQDLERPGEAEALYREALETFRSTVGVEHPNHPNLGFILMGYGNVLNDLDRPEEAQVVLEQALELWQRRDQGEKRNGQLARSRLAHSLVLLGRYQSAEVMLLTSLP